MSLQVAAPLCATPGSCSNVPINVLCSSNFVGMTLNDGVNTVSVNSNCSAGAQAWVTTDANGNINAWYLDATASGNKDIHTLYDPAGAIAGACNSCYSNSATGNEQDYGQFSPPHRPTVIGLWL